MARRQTPKSFLKKIRKMNSGCWHFTGSISTTGYGKIGYAGKVMLAHRLSFMFFRGEINNLMVLHSCDNRKCVNPDHLFLGTAKDNTRDMIEKGRRVARVSQTHCRRGHELTPDNVYCHRSSGNRVCRKCHTYRASLYKIGIKISDL